MTDYGHLKYDAIVFLDVQDTLFMLRAIINLVISAVSERT